MAKIEIFPLCIGHSCTTLRVKNLLEIALSLKVFEIFTLFHFPLKSKMAAKSGENSNFPLSIGYCCTTLWVKNSLEIALSLMVCEIFVIFHIFTKSSNKVAITHLYIEQQLRNLNTLQFTNKQSVTE